MSSKSDREKSFIESLLFKAGLCALRYFDSGLEVTRKGDGSPVTEADQEVESLIRAAIAEEFPDDGILGEEGDAVEGGGRRWIIDPIDGTMNFSRGIPLFSILLALEEEGEIKAGAIYNPVWKDMFLAFAGAGAFKNGERLRVSTRNRLEDALVAFGGPDRIVEKGLWSKLGEVIGCTYRQRGYGDYLGFAYVFEGRVEANIEVDLKPWDLAPMKVLVEEAGGVYRDFAGGSSIYQGSCIVGNGEIVSGLEEILHGG